MAADGGEGLGSGRPRTGAQDRSPTLAILGLRTGEAVRWRDSAAGRWHQGTVAHRERDGSIGVHDERGMARSLAVDRLEVHRVGRRGGKGWEPLTLRAARCEQLRLLP